MTPYVKMKTINKILFLVCIAIISMACDDENEVSPNPGPFDEITEIKGSWVISNPQNLIAGYYTSLQSSYSNESNLVNLQAFSATFNVTSALAVKKDDGFIEFFTERKNKYPFIKIKILSSTATTMDVEVRSCVNDYITGQQVSLIKQ